MIAEAIIPKTDTPGAIEAGVPAWIEVIVKDCFEEADQRIILDAAQTRSESLGDVIPDSSRK